MNADLFKQGHIGFFNFIFVFIFILFFLLAPQLRAEIAGPYVETTPAEDSWLGGVSGGESQDEQISDADDPDSEPGISAPITKMRKRWAKHYGIWADYGVGYFTSGFQRAARDTVFGYDKLFFDALELGLYLRLASVTYPDSVYFANTGYTETRTYEISSLLLGPHLRYRLYGKFGLVTGMGVSFLQSKLKSVTTDAPLASSLQAGDTTNYPIDLGYDLGFYYRYKLGPFRLGTEFGYSLNSLREQEAMGELYVVLHIELYGRHIIEEAVVENPAVE